LVTGPCRSGKSAYALEHAEKCGPRRLFIATAQIFDAEMETRVKRHRAERGSSWTTIEEARDPAGIIRNTHNDYDVILLDCITLWLTNLLGDGLSDEQILGRVEDLCAALQESNAHIIIVTNETGWSIVPENALARRFRDLAGFANQRLAQAAESVILTVAGLPMVIKGEVS
jgi:adenosylcobinamide kinase/adenosylcobinamide-phosphate guanylyltransferase